MSLVKDLQEIIHACDVEFFTVDKNLAESNLCLHFHLVGQKL